MTTEDHACQARGVDIRTADYIAKERADIKWRAERAGFVPLEQDEYANLQALYVQHCSLMSSEFQTSSNPNPCAADPVISKAAAFFAARTEVAPLPPRSGTPAPSPAPVDEQQ